MSSELASAEILGRFPGVAVSLTGKDYLQLEVMHATIDCENIRCTTVGPSLGYLPFAHEVSFNATVSLQAYLVFHLLWSPGLLISTRDFTLDGFQSTFGLGGGAFFGLARMKYELEKERLIWEFGVGVRHYFID